nr:hypothetical protein [Xylanibacter caecicola]
MALVPTYARTLVPEDVIDLVLVHAIQDVEIHVKDTVTEVVINHQGK